MSQPELLSDEQVARLIANALQARARNGGVGCTEDELGRLIDHVQTMIIDAALTRMILQCDVAFDPVGEDPDDWQIVLLTAKPTQRSA